jgi:hypothetical protein
MIVSILAGIALSVGYLIYALSAAAPALDDLGSWAIAILVFIGIGIATIIVIMIIFHIALSISITIKEGDCDDKQAERILDSTMLEDEREKLIDLKSMRVGYSFMGIAFVAALVALALGASPVLALHILLASCLVGNLIGGCVSVYYYERGV